MNLYDKLSDFTKDRMKELANHIEKSDKIVKMCRIFLRRESKDAPLWTTSHATRSPCGTICCLAGHILVIKDGEETDESGAYRRAAEWLGLDYNDYEEERILMSLFEPYGFSDSGLTEDEEKKRGLEVLRGQRPFTRDWLRWEPTDKEQETTLELA